MIITYLTSLRDLLDDADNNGEVSLYLYNNSQARYPFVVSLLNYVVARQNYKFNNDAQLASLMISFDSQMLQKHKIWGDELSKGAKFAYDIIANNYEAGVYSCHDTHFHTGFNSFLNCPFTSLTEIKDIVEKVIKLKLKGE